MRTALFLDTALGDIIQKCPELFGMADTLLAAEECGWKYMIPEMRVLTEAYDRVTKCQPCEVSLDISNPHVMRRGADYIKKLVNAIMDDDSSFEDAHKKLKSLESITERCLGENPLDAEGIFPAILLSKAGSVLGVYGGPDWDDTVPALEVIHIGPDFTRLAKGQVVKLYYVGDPTSFIQCIQSTAPIEQHPIRQEVAELLTKGTYHGFETNLPVPLK